jgi:hypothetical protein
VKTGKDFHGSSGSWGMLAVMRQILLSISPQFVQMF